MQIDGVPSVPPIDSISSVQPLEGRVGQSAAISSEAATGSGDELSSMARHRRSSKGSRRSLGAVGGLAAGDTANSADAPVAGYIPNNITSETNIHETTGGKTHHGEPGMGGVEFPGEYIATAPGLRGGDRVGPGIELPVAVPGPIIDKIV